MTMRFGRYEVIEELGGGGMGQVYLAHDPQFQRDVAVKVLRSDGMDQRTFLERFLQEARVIASLEHRAIVPVYDFGHVDGSPYLVMRYMKGDTLIEKMENGAIEPTECAKILRPIAEALDYAHSQGIVHRDVKPGNILFDDKDNPYLTDFGTAKFVEEGDETVAHMTQIGEVLGTPTYMSPEHVEAAELDGRSDVYSLGIVLYEMLCSDVPYKAPTSFQTALKHVTAPIPKITKSNSELSASMQSIIDRALAKDRAERFQTAIEMVETLAAQTNGSVPSTALLAKVVEETAPIEAPVESVPERSAEPPAPSVDSLKSEEKKLSRQPHEYHPIEPQPETALHPRIPDQPAQRSRSRSSESGSERSHHPQSEPKKRKMPRWATCLMIMGVIAFFMLCGVISCIANL